jgi:PAS domain S-box-containing protein
VSSETRLFGRGKDRFTWPWPLTALVMASIVLLVWLSGRESRSLLALQEGNDWVAHTERVRYDISQVLVLLTDVETAERGFMVEGDASFLAPYQPAMSQLPPAITALKQATTDNPRQQANARALESRALACLAHTQEAINDVKRGNFGAARALAADGKRRMDAARETAAQMQAEETRLLAQRQIRSVAALHETQIELRAAGGLAIVLLIVTAITAELSRRKIRRAEKALATTLRSIGDAVIATDAGGSVQFMNSVAETLTGWSEKEAQGRPVDEIFHIVNEHSRAPVESPVAKVLREGTVVNLANHTLLIARNGSEYPVEDSGAPIRDGGALVGVVLVFRDDTARRAAESVFRSTFENAAVGIAHVATDGRFLRVNDQLCAIIGYSKEELLARTFGDITYTEDLDADLKHARALLAGEIASYATEKRYVRKDRSLVWAKLTVGLVRDALPPYFISVVEDVTARKATEASLAERERRYAALADAMPQLVWVNHPDGTNDFMNHRWQTYTGLTLEQLRGLSGWNRVVHPEDVKGVQAQWARAIETGEHYETEFRLRRQDGSYCWFLARAEADRNEQGAILRWFGTCTDIDASKRNEERLRKTEAALREEDRRKDLFLATLSHELRNPLAPIRNAASFLEKPELNAEDVERSRLIIARQVRHMASLLDDLLDISRIARGGVTLKKEYANLQGLLTEALEAARPLIDAKRHTLTLEWPEQPVEMEVDPVRLVQIVVNLLCNAAKYTDPEGEITVGARTEDKNLVIFVRDTGIGLAPDMLTRVFEMFTQVQTTQDRTEGGLGIGLALVKGLVELHGGRVEARSEGVERGSEFIVYLPDGCVPTGTLAHTPSAKGDDEIRNKICRILIADDNRDGADSLAMLLKLSGHEVQTAHTGLDALQMAAKHRPHIAILDIGMPGLSGYEVAQQIRREAWGAHMKLIAVTGWGQADDKYKAQRAGFDHHLTKPVDPMVLEALFTATTQLTAWNA